MRLLTIPFSHFCEKARWALDFVGVKYREDAYLPAMHVIPMRRVGGRTLPVLVTADRTYTDSTEILEFLDELAAPSRKLFPVERAARSEAKELEEFFDEVLGPATRLLAYYYVLPVPQRMAKILGTGLPASQRVAMRVLTPLIGPVISKKYGIRAESAAHALESVDRVFDRVAAMLADGRSYLCGGAFTGADLTLSALAAPMLAPPGHPVHTADVAVLPDEMASVVSRLRSMPAGAHVLRVYREHRRSSFASSAPTI